MNVELSRRLGAALDNGTFTDRQLVIRAAGSAETFDDLSSEIQRLVIQLEKKGGA